MRNTRFVLLAILSLFLFSGCPDYSHLRDVPDYENMSDGNGEFSEDADTGEE